MHQVIYKCHPQSHLPSPIWQECNGAQIAGKTELQEPFELHGGLDRTPRAPGRLPQRRERLSAKSKCTLLSSRDTCCHRRSFPESNHRGHRRSLPANEDGLRLQKKSTLALYSTLHGRCRLQGRSDGYVLPTNLCCGDSSYREKRSHNDDEHLSHSTGPVPWSPYTKTHLRSITG